MIRRLAASLLLWVGVLALASPVLACGSPESPPRDCCPEGMPSPCGGTDAPAAVPVCCAALPIVTQAVTVEAPRAQHEQPLDPGSPDPLLLAVWLHSIAAAADPSAPPSVSCELDLGRTATLTYLHTGRLRL
jgi:hypothetical protein